MTNKVKNLEALMSLNKNLASVSVRKCAPTVMWLL